MVLVNKSLPINMRESKCADQLNFEGVKNSLLLIDWNEVFTCEVIDRCWKLLRNIE